MRQPGRYDLTIYRGDTYHWRFALWADAERSEPFDLTDVAVKAEIRNRPSGASVIPIECSIEGEGQVSGNWDDDDAAWDDPELSWGDTPNVINAVLSAAACQRIPIAGAFWDLQLT